MPDLTPSDIAFQNAGKYLRWKTQETGSTAVNGTPTDGVLVDEGDEPTVFDPGSYSPGIFNLGFGMTTNGATFSGGPYVFHRSYPCETVNKKQNDLFILAPV